MLEQVGDDIKFLNGNNATDSFTLFQSQQQNSISTLASRANASDLSQKVIPLFSKHKLPSTHYPPVVPDQKNKPVSRNTQDCAVEAKYNRISTDPNFPYKKISEVPEQFRSIFSHFPHFNKVQSKVFDDVLYSDNPIVLSSPTGSGKTVVFELAIIRALIQTPSHEIPKIKIVYMAPLKALCTERLSDWKRKFSPFNIKCLEVTGDSDIDDYSAIKTTNLIFTTPEKWDSVTRKWKEHISQMGKILLFLVDEVHMVGDSERGSTIEAVISRMKCIKDVTKSSLRFVAVSATIPNPEDFASWLSSSNMDSVCFKLDESYRPVPLQKVVLTYGDCTPSTAFKFDLNLNYKLHSVIQQYSSQCPTIVFCSTRKSTVQAASTLQSQKRFVFKEQERQYIRDFVGNVVDCKLRELLLCGIGYHHAGLSPSDRKVVEDLFTAGYLPVICATSTLAMGVNLPAHLVIVKSTIHYAGGKFREYSSADVLQMIGRAGRPQFDTSAVAVIMTQNSTKTVYNNLISGVQVIESNIHHNLTEHLNSEIVLKTLTHLKIATKWMTSLFLYVRISKNPTRYGLPAKVNSTQIKDFLQNAVMNGINSLKELNFISYLPDGTISPTGSGSLMARYCINFNTMKTFSLLKGDESLNDLLSTIAASDEFSDVQLRVREKSTLNLLNKNKNGPVVRYPFKDRIKTSQMKTSILLQSVLGCIPINDFSLNQESVRVVQVASRVSKCLLEFQSLIPSFHCYVNCLLLMKCLNCKLWENTKFVARQFKNVGPMLGNSLANAGIVTLQKILSTDPRELEMITNKNPPFGTNLADQVSSVPQYDLFVQQTGDIDTHKATLQVMIKPKQEKEPSLNTVTSLVIGTPENVLTYKRKLRDKNLFEDQGFQCEVSVYRSSENQSVIFWLISHSFVGGDIKSKFIPKFKEDPLFKKEQAPAVSQAKLCETVKKGKKSAPNPYQGSFNPYAQNRDLHTQKMSSKLNDSSHIFTSKNVNRNVVGPNLPKLEEIVKAPEELEPDFDDLPEIDWKIKEIIEPQTNTKVPISAIQSHTISRDQINHRTPVEKLQVVKPILKAPKSNLKPTLPLPTSSNNYKAQFEDTKLDVLVQEMQDSGYFDDFERSRSFDVGVDDLLGEDSTEVPNEKRHSNITVSQSSLPDLTARPTSVSLPIPMVNLTAHHETSNSSEHEIPITRIDENGDKYRECGHKCADKTSCSHFCCRYGVKVKQPYKRSSSLSSDGPPNKKSRIPIKDNHSFFTDKQITGNSSSKTDGFLLSKPSTSSVPFGNPYNDKPTKSVCSSLPLQDVTSSSHGANTFDPVSHTPGPEKPIRIVNSSYSGTDWTSRYGKQPPVRQQPGPVPFQACQQVNYPSCISENHVKVPEIKQRYVETLLKSKSNDKSDTVAQEFEATQPPKFETNFGFYDRGPSRSSSSTFSSIFDGIL